MDTQENVGKSIIDPKYRKREKVADWFTNFVDERVTVAETKTKTVKTTDEAGNAVESSEVVTLKRRKLDLDALFALAKINGIETAKMEEQRDRLNAAGRIRMTLGNSLRAAAKHRHGLFDASGEWHVADADFIGDAPLTQLPDGTKIVVEKAAAVKAEATEEAPAE